ncbi:hypothetical protein LCAC16_PA110003 [Leuconostoc carnosum]|nr:hypothetical protein LCAC16_PA110003 [Leuconostoc carnosum]
MNCRKRAGGSKFTRVISQRTQTVSITATLVKTCYVELFHYNKKATLLLSYDAY